MQLVDANVLLSAANSDSSRHEEARAWLEEALRSPGSIGFAWVVLLGFLRIATSAIFPRPLTVEEAFALVDDWLTARSSVVVHPTGRHLDLLRGLLAESGAAANLTTDAHLAALALEHGAEVVTFDRDFARFTGLAWRPPGETR